jgi:hypothetical protein
MGKDREPRNEKLEPGQTRAEHSQLERTCSLDMAHTEELRLAQAPRSTRSGSRRRRELPASQLDMRPSQPGLVRNRTVGESRSRATCSRTE